jgi:hypothetical protein
MNNAKYTEIRNTELKSKHDFNFSEVLKHASNNDYWRGKEALWTVISGACNEAGKEYFVKQSNFIQNLADIDTCNIHSLKSIAKSVAAEDYTNFLLENYPEKIVDLLNLFSVPKHILFSENGILNFESIGPIIGNIDYRNTFLDNAFYYNSLIMNININLSHIKEILAINLNTFSKGTSGTVLKDNINNSSIFDLLSLTNAKIDMLDIKGQSINKIKYYKKEGASFIPCYFEKPEGSTEILDSIWKTLTVADILATCEYICERTESVDNPVSVSLLEKFQEAKPFTTKVPISETITEEVLINPYHILIFIMKGFLWNFIHECFFITKYYNPQLNEFVELRSLYCDIIETIQNYDENYLNDFVTYHFYGLLYDMIFNPALQSEWEWPTTSDNTIIANPNFIGYNSEFTKAELLEKLNAYLTIEEIEKATEHIVYFNEYQVDFFQALRIINSYIDPEIQFPYNIPYYNNNIIGNNVWTKYKKQLIGELGETNHILSVAKYFTNVCLQILYARENIKEIIQQYSVIGTKQIISDVIRSYFMKNYSDPADWRFLPVDELFQSTTNEKRRIPMDILNGKTSDSSFFSLNLVEYWDNTNYFNIEAELPMTVVGSSYVGMEPVGTFDITSAAVVSTIVVDENISAHIPSVTGLTTMRNPVQISSLVLFPLLQMIGE